MNINIEIQEGENYRRADERAREISFNTSPNKYKFYVACFCIPFAYDIWKLFKKDPNQITHTHTQSDEIKNCFGFEICGERMARFLLEFFVEYFIESCKMMLKLLKSPPRVWHGKFP